MLLTRSVISLVKSAKALLRQSHSPRHLVTEEIFLLAMKLVIGPLRDSRIGALAHSPLSRYSQTRMHTRA